MRIGVTYFRTSTQKQGRSGLGVEAQRKTVEDFLAGDDWEIVGEFTETESGRKSDRQRPQLRAALQLCRDKGATLIVAKLDRLARNAYFLLHLLESGVPIVACDVPQLGNPAQNRLILGVMASVAEFEAARISDNTKAALAAAKRRYAAEGLGRRLGNPNPGTGKQKRRAKKQAKKVADDFARLAGPIIDELEEYGCTTLEKLAAGLKARGVRTARGNQDWSLSAVRNCRLRWQKIAAKNSANK